MLDAGTNSRSELCAYNTRPSLSCTTRIPTKACDKGEVVSMMLSSVVARSAAVVGGTKMVTAIATASSLVMSCVNVGGGMDSPDADLFLPLAGFSYVIGGLHPYEGVHLDPKGLFDAQRHNAGKIGAAVP